MLGTILIPILLLLGALVAVIYLRTAELKKVEEQFKLLAKRYDLKFELKQSWHSYEPTLTGFINEKPFKLWLWHQGVRHRIYYTAFSIQGATKKSYTFTIYQEDFFNRIGKFFGTQDIEIKDADFDELFIIQSNHEPFARQVLDKFFRDKLEQNNEILKGKLNISAANRIYYEETIQLNDDTDRQRFEQLIDLAYQLSERLDAPADGQYDLF